MRKFTLWSVDYSLLIWGDGLPEPRYINKQSTNGLRFFMDFVENIREIHIGRMIREKLTEKSISITEFADLIHRARPTVYGIFGQKSIDTELLIAISKALDFDFIRKAYYGEESSPDIYVAIKTNEKLDLPEEFIRLVKSKR